MKKNILSLIIFLFAVLKCSGTEHYSKSEPYEVFKTFPGQGSFNIVRQVFRDQRFVFIFDAGVSSQQTHEKLFLADGVSSPFLRPIKRQETCNDHMRLALKGIIGSKREREENDETKIRIDELSEEATPKKQPIDLKSSGDSEYVDASTGKHTKKKSIDDQALDFIVKFEPAYVMFFGSHKDMDHWNRAKLIPDNVPTFFFINGWIEHESFKSDVCNRKNLILFDSSKSDLILNKGLGDLITDNILIESDVLKTGLSIETRSNIKKDLSTYRNELNAIHFWVLNPSSKDPNGNSYIASYTFSDLDVSILFTGDALPETFSHLNTIGYDKKLGLIRSNTGQKSMAHQVFCMLPHHGSKHNMNNLILDLFKPNAFIITAGNGIQYGHPSKQSFEMIEGYYHSKTYQPIDAFWKKYVQPEHCQSGSFLFEGSDKKYKTFLRRNENGKIPVFGTNFMGSISLKSDGIWFQERNFSIEFNGQIFDLDLAKREFYTSNISPTLTRLANKENLGFYQFPDSLRYSVTIYTGGIYIGYSAKLRVNQSFPSRDDCGLSDSNNANERSSSLDGKSSSADESDDLDNFMSQLSIARQLFS